MYARDYILDKGVFLSPFCEGSLDIGLLYDDVQEFLDIVKKKNVNLISVEVHELSKKDSGWLGRFDERIGDISFYNYFKNNQTKPLFVIDFSEGYYDERIIDFKIRLQNRQHDFKVWEVDKCIIQKVTGKKVDFSDIRVFRREVSDEAYEAWLSKSENLKISENKTYIDKSIGAKLNGEIEVGFFIHVEEGYLRKIEGYTFGEDWPEEIESVEFFDIDKI